jgi:hypothetical protein
MVVMQASSKPYQEKWPFYSADFVAVGENQVFPAVKAFKLFTSLAWPTNLNNIRTPDLTQQYELPLYPNKLSNICVLD